MRLGGPPRSPRSAQRPEGARSCRAHVQFGKCPQSPASRTRCPSPRPSASSAVRGYARQRRLWPASLPPCGGSLRRSPRPRSSESRAPTSCSPATSQAAKNRSSLRASPDAPPPLAREAVIKGESRPGKADAYEKVLPVQKVCKMAAPMELFCWSGGWGLPSVDLDSLAVLVRDDAGVLCDAL